MTECSICKQKTISQRPKRFFIIFFIFLVIFLFSAFLIFSSDFDFMNALGKAIWLGFLKSTFWSFVFFGNIFKRKYYCKNCNTLFDSSGNIINKNIYALLKSANKDSAADKSLNIPLFIFAILLIVAPVIIGSILLIQKVEIEIQLFVRNEISVLSEGGEIEYSDDSQTLEFLLKIIKSNIINDVEISLSNIDGNELYYGKFRKGKMVGKFKFHSVPNEDMDYRKIAIIILNELYHIHTCVPDSNKIESCIKLITEENFDDFAVSDEAEEGIRNLRESATFSVIVESDNVILNQARKKFPFTINNSESEEYSSLNIEFTKRYVKEKLESSHYLRKELIPILSNDKKFQLQLISEFSFIYKR